jgi:ribosomal protein S18 acetylase RimI-like enzyme
MARLTRRPLPEPDPAVKRCDDPDELRALLGAELSSLRSQLGPFFGVRDAAGALTAAGGAEFVTPELAQLAWIKTDLPQRRRGLARAVVVELVRELESPQRRVVLQVASDNRAAIDLYAELGFRGSRRLGRYELSA